MSSQGAKKKRTLTWRVSLLHWCCCAENMCVRNRLLPSKTDRRDWISGKERGRRDRRSKDGQHSLLTIQDCTTCVILLFMRHRCELSEMTDGLEMAREQIQTTNRDLGHLQLLPTLPVAPFSIVIC